MRRTSGASDQRCFGILNSNHKNRCKINIYFLVRPFLHGQNTTKDWYEYGYKVYVLIGWDFVLPELDTIYKLV